VTDQREIAEAVEKRSVQDIEDSLQRLWEKARAVSDLIVRLKNENKELRMQVESLKEQERLREEERSACVQQLEQLRAQLNEMQNQGQALIAKEEKEELKAKIRELIAKINSHL